MDALNSAKEKAVQRRLDNFAKQYGSDRLNLARHAALPVAFTPDLLYCIWSNFQGDQQPWPEWVGVADVLLSRLCKEVSHELYELDTEVRDVLLQQLAEYFGQGRVQEVARFLVAYAEYERQRTANPDVEDLAEAQRWVALAYLDPDRVVAEVSDALQQPNEANHWRILNLQSVFPPDLRPRLEKLIQESRPHHHVTLDFIDKSSTPEPPIVEVGIKTDIDDTKKIITSFFFEGTLPPDDPTYIPRKAENDLLKACLRGEFAYVLGERQNGKSSMMIGVGRQLRKDDIDVVLIDLAGINTPKTDAKIFYNHLLNKISEQLKFGDTFLLNKGNSEQFNFFLETKILPNIKTSLVIFIDEVDTILGLDFTADFIANIRFLYEQRTVNPIYNKLTFVLVGMAIPEELNNDSLRTPFNMGQHIELADFTKAELEPYRVPLINKHPQHGDQYFEDIFAWTNGHPYLTQKLCSLVPKRLTVSSLVDKFMTSQMDSNIAFIQSRLIESKSTREILEVYQRVVNGERVIDDVKSHIFNQLKLTGIVVVKNGFLQIRNKLYATIFDEIWVKGSLDSFKFHIPSNIYISLLKLLRDIDYFYSDDHLRNVFVDNRITQWRTYLVKKNNVGERIDILINLLHDKQNWEGKNALVLFLQVLQDNFDIADAYHHELKNLAEELEKVFETRPLSLDSSKEKTVSTSTTEDYLLGIPSDIYVPLRKLLMDEYPFHSRDLQAIFRDQRISQWRYDLVQENTLSKQVETLINLLLNKQNWEGKNALVLFLQVLQDSSEPNSILHQQLKELTQKLEGIFEKQSPSLASSQEEFKPTPSTQNDSLAIPRDTVRLNAKQRVELVDLLAACHMMQNRAGRDLVVQELPFWEKIKRDSRDRFDIIGIINTCLTYPDGINMLLHAMLLYEGKSLTLPFQTVLAKWNEWQQTNQPAV